MHNLIYKKMQISGKKTLLKKDPNEVQKSLFENKDNTLLTSIRNIKKDKSNIDSSNEVY